jgi:hypothetical protein
MFTSPVFNRCVCNIFRIAITHATRQNNTSGSFSRRLFFLVLCSYYHSR